MEFNFTVVRLVAYGDFDIPQTRSVWVAPANTTVPPSATYGRDTNIERAERDLQDAGFTKVHTRVLTVGGEL